MNVINGFYTCYVAIFNIHTYVAFYGQGNAYISSVPFDEVWQMHTHGNSNFSQDIEY